MKKITYLLRRYLKNSFVVIKRDGLFVFLERVFYSISDTIRILFNSFEVGENYNFLRESKEQDLLLNKEKFKNILSDLKYQPLMSVIMPVYNVDIKWLKDAIYSVQNQFYENWELCIVDDASTKKEIRPFLMECSKKDARVKVKFLDTNLHISRSSNEAIKMASGEFIALLDNDDVMTRDALLECVKVLNADKQIDAIYSDEDKIDENGVFFEPMYKSDWNIKKLLRSMYTGHLSLYRKKIIDKIGGFREGYEGSQDYDLILRFSEEARKIFHIKKILYHWRALGTSVSLNPSAKEYAYESGKRALEDYLVRNNIKGSVKMLSKGFYKIIK